MEVPSKKDYLTPNSAGVAPPTKSGHTDYHLGPDEFGVYDDAATYYRSEARHGGRYHNRSRTYSQVSLVPAQPMVDKNSLLTSWHRMASINKWSVWV
jgi:hypothetical protein